MLFIFPVKDIDKKLIMWSSNFSSGVLKWDLKIGRLYRNRSEGANLLVLNMPQFCLGLPLISVFYRIWKIKQNQTFLCRVWSFSFRLRPFPLVLPEWTGITPASVHGASGLPVPDMPGACFSSHQSRQPRSRHAENATVLSELGTSRTGPSTGE